jgi:colicin import membrane protein
MPAATDRIDLAPPSDPARATSLALAVLAHLFLMLALTWGISWNREPQDLSAEAELWSSVPQEAAPAPLPAPPAPAVVQAPPINTPAPPPEPKVVAPPPPAPAPPKQPDIKVEQEKRREEQARRQEELERQQQLEARRQQQELDRKKELDARRKREEAEKHKQLEAQKKQQEDKRLAERKAAEKKRAEELAKAKAKEQQDAKVRELTREEQLARMRNLATGTGGLSSQGSAQQSSGPSSSYAGRIRARVRPNIVFTDDIAGNPTAEVEVRMAPDGTIVGKRVLKSSGVAAWDDAVLRALEKTEVLPRDIDGRVHSPLIIEFRPKS